MKKKYLLYMFLGSILLLFLLPLVVIQARLESSDFRNYIIESIKHNNTNVESVLSIWG